MKKNLSLEIENFDIEQIANSGQCFRMYDLGNGTWEVFALDEKVKIQKDNKTINFLLENFQALQNSHIIVFQLFKNIFGKLFQKYKVEKENIW